MCVDKLQIVYGLVIRTSFHRRSAHCRLGKSCKHGKVFPAVDESLWIDFRSKLKPFGHVSVSTSSQLVWKRFDLFVKSEWQLSIETFKLNWCWTIGRGSLINFSLFRLVSCRSLIKLWSRQREELQLSGKSHRKCLKYSFYYVITAFQLFFSFDFPIQTPRSVKTKNFNANYELPFSIYILKLKACDVLSFCFLFIFHRHHHRFNGRDDLVIVVTRFKALLLSQIIKLRTFHVLNLIRLFVCFDIIFPRDWVDRLPCANVRSSYWMKSFKCDYRIIAQRLLIYKSEKASSLISSSRV